MINAFYSDPHFGHAKIIEYCNRPFRDSEHQTADLISRYNERIAPSDTVLWVGDCFFCGPDEAAEIMDALNGRKMLVRGNHELKPHAMVALGFGFVTDELYMRVAGRRVLVSHYPYRQNMREGDERYAEQLPLKKKNQILIHGHTHSTNRREPLASIHVGVDAWDYRPAMYDEVAHEIGLL